MVISFLENDVFICDTGTVMEIPYLNSLECFVKNWKNEPSIIFEYINECKPGEMPIYVSHVKPVYPDETRKELSSIVGNAIRLLGHGSKITI